MILVGAASTQSRGRRPLPPGAVSGETLWSSGVRERVRFTYANGATGTRELLSWPLGQWGGLWGSPMPAKDILPFDIWHAVQQSAETPGSYGHKAEHALAETLADIYGPYIVGGQVGVRLALNGSDACNMAARLARAFTKRDVICGYGYHGHSDAYAFSPATGGILPDTIAKYYYESEIGPVPRHNYPAALVVEIPAWDDDTRIAEVMYDYRRFCDASGALLVVDEVVTGARLGIAGACQRYGIMADVVLLGKAISAVGLCSAIVGRKDVVGMLADQVFYSGTFFGHPGVAGVANATMRWLQEHQETFFNLDLIGGMLKRGLNALGIKTVGQNARSVMQFQNDAAWLNFCSQMIESGVVMHRPQFPCLGHSLDDVAQTLAVAADVCAKLA